MRLFEYIIRGGKLKSKEVEDFNNSYGPIIDRNCKKILDVYKSQHKFLYRGITMTEDFIEKEMRTTVRIPRNVDKKTHVRLNKLMKDKFGWKVRDGVSVSTEETQAMFYGNPFMFFPTDDYKFVYAKSISDLFRNIKPKPVGMPEKEWEPKEMRSLTRLVNKHQDTDLPGAWSRDGEVLFKMKKYYLLSWAFRPLAMERWGI